MKRSSNPNPQKNSPLYNLVFIIVLLLTALPFILFALIQFAPPSFGTSKTVAAADTSTKRLTAAERRAARRPFPLSSPFPLENHKSPPFSLFPCAAPAQAGAKRRTDEKDAFFRKARFALAKNGYL